MWLNNNVEPNEFATVSGGSKNKAEAAQSTIMGGFWSLVCEDCSSGTFFGCHNNTIDGEGSTECTIGAGSGIKIENSPSSTIVSGNKNSIKNINNAGSIGGGQENHITCNFAVIGGKQQNNANW